MATKLINATRESKRIEFKESFDPNAPGEWCELLKDVVAMANSGGGTILFGVKNNGTQSGWDPTPLLEFDSAKIIDKIAKYTGRQFDKFDLRKETRSGQPIAVMEIGTVDVPLIFEQPGTYDIGGSKQKTAFGQGTLFFRHGAKSEPAKYADLYDAVDRIVKERRRFWFKNIRRVTQAEPGDTIQVVRPPAAGAEPPLGGRIVSDKDAAPVRPAEADSVWPYRQKDVVKRFNEQLTGVYKITPYDIQVVKKQFDIEKKHPEFMYKPFIKGSPQFSQAFVDWLADQFRKDPSFFRKARQWYGENS